MGVIWWHDANGCHCKFDNGSVINQDCSQADCETCCKQKENEMPGYVTDSGSGGNNFDAYGNPVQQLSDIELPEGLTMNSLGNIVESVGKEIRALEVQNDLTFINAKGENRIIRIIGTPGAGFTLTIKDSSGCSIMEEELENVEIPNGSVYKFTQEFPDITTSASGGLVEEYYEITITPHADVKLLGNIGDGVPTFTLYQYPDPTITFATTTSQTLPGLSVAVSGLATKRGRAGTFDIGESYLSWILTITEDSGTAGNFYIKNTSFNENITTDSVIKKVVTREVGEDPTSPVLNLKPLTTRTIEGITDSKLTAGMIITGKVERTKIVTNSLEVPSCKRKTDKFELSNTDDLFEEMLLYIDGVLLAQVTSIDCERNITISKKIAIRQNTDIVLRHDIGATISEVVSESTPEGNTCIRIDRYAYIPNNVELEFDDNDTRISGITRFGGSGADSIVLTNEIYITKYGIKDVTYTLDLDNIITRKPNAKDFNIEVSKNGTNTVHLSNGDFDTNRLSKVPSITQKPSHGTAVAYDVSDSGYTGPAIKYTAIKDFVGDDEIRYKLKDDDEATDLSDEKTIRITVK